MTRSGGFVAVLPQPGTSAGGVVVELPDGIRITGLAAAEVALVVVAVRAGGGR
jgi:hypothetical protein